MRLLFVTTGLGVGGAERQLVNLLSELCGNNIELAVISLRGGGAVSDEIQALGIRVWTLGLEKATHLPRAVSMLRKCVADVAPNIIQGWMYHGNIAANLARRLAAPWANVAWGVRQSLYDLAREKVATRQVIRLSAWLSSRADAIVYNSETSRSQHESHGFAAVRGTVIDNGIDTRVFKPDSQARRALRSELGLTEDAPLIGLVARFHPMKGHAFFLNAAARLAYRHPDVRFVLVGLAATFENPALIRYFEHPALLGRVHCLGQRSDIPRLTAAFDIASSTSSWGEAFPNAIGEAMACAVPVVATDVGDVRRIVGDAGAVVPVEDEEALTEAWTALLADPKRRNDLGECGRVRVVECFSVEKMVQQYWQLYEGMVR